MSQLKTVETKRLTAKRFITLTSEQWNDFIQYGSFLAKVYSSYSLRVNDSLSLTTKMDSLTYQFNPMKDVIVSFVDEAHSSPREGGYIEVLFKIL